MLHILKKNLGWVFLSGFYGVFLGGFFQCQPWNMCIFYIEFKGLTDIYQVCENHIRSIENDVQFYVK